MILHLASDEKFIDYIIEIFEKAHPSKNIYLIPGKEAELKYIKSRGNNIIITPIYSQTYKEITNNLSIYSGVIIHNFVDSYKKELVLNSNKNVYFHWMAWGADFYFIPQLSGRLLSPITKQRKSKVKLPILFFKFQQFLQKKISILWDMYALFFGNSDGYHKFKAVLKKVSSYTTVIPEEVRLTNKFLDLKSIPFIPFKYATIENSLGKYKNELCTNRHLLIGNSATITNNHLDTFNLLKNIDCDIKIYVPLSYGDENYASDIISEGEKLFSNQFYPITEFMDKDRFNDLLNNCGNVIMNHHRQQALGTLLISLWKGARVYLNPLNPLNHFFKSNGFITFLLTDLKREQNLPPFHDLARTNRLCISRLYSEKNVVMETKSLIHHIINAKNQ